MNVPPYIIAQLEKANDVIRRQSAELDRLRSSGLSVENVALRNQLMQVAQEYSRQRFLDQEVLLSELNFEVKSLARDKDILQERCIELERKYKKAKATSKEFEKIMEAADQCSSLVPDSPSLLERSRKKHRSPSKKDERDDSLQVSLENAQIEIEDIRSRLEKEVNMSKSLHDDLGLSRKLVLEKDEQIHELSSKLRDAELKCHVLPLTSLLNVLAVTN
ncbi:hypothetical protein V3C99_000817 [Haemonchus contortus]